MDPIDPKTHIRAVKRIHWLAAGSLAAVAAVAGIYYWNYAQNYESTDDAVIDGHIVPINSKVAGQVQKIYVDDNQKVKKGDPLIDIDSADYAVKLDQAKAELAAAEAEAKRADDDATRYQRLYSHDQVSRQTFDKAVADAGVLNAGTALAQQKVIAAELDLSYTKIIAPESGKVARKVAEIRSFVQVGQPLMAIVPDEVWVTANFKETQMTRMRPGQPAAVSVDTYPGRVFRGHVDSIQSGTGSRFSLFPPENATGNFVKVVQRVPVKIVFDEPTAGYLLVPGMSVTPVVTLQ